jgi:hypothetical protein
MAFSTIRIGSPQLGSDPDRELVVDLAKLIEKRSGELPLMSGREMTYPYILAVSTDHTSA